MSRDFSTPGIIRTTIKSTWDLLSTTSYFRMNVNISLDTSFYMHYNLSQRHYQP